MLLALGHFNAILACTRLLVDHRTRLEFLVTLIWTVASVSLHLTYNKQGLTGFFGGAGRAFFESLTTVCVTIITIILCIVWFFMLRCAQFIPLYMLAGAGLIASNYPAAARQKLVNVTGIQTLQRMPIVHVFVFTRLVWIITAFYVMAQFSRDCTHW